MYENIDNTFEFIYKFNPTGFVDPHMKNMIENTTSQPIISYFNLKKYVSDNKKSYGNKLEKIYAQFEKDYSRQYIVLNNTIYDDHIDFINMLTSLLQITNVPLYMKLLYPFSILSCDHVYDISYVDLIILICCQSSFFLPFQILKNLYNDNNDVEMLVSGTGDKKNITIIIDINDKFASVNLHTMFFIKNIDNDNITKKIKLNLSIKFEFSEIAKSDSHIALFSWNIE